MTNEELIQAIKAEIGKHLDALNKVKHLATFSEEHGYNHGFEDAMRDLLSFLSTLEEEKPMNPEAAMKELDEKIALVKQRGTWDGVDVDKYMDEVRGREPEKSMNLEEEVKRYYSDNFDYISSDQPTLSILTNIARHFAEWGYLRAAEKYNEIEYNRQREEESVPKVLEKAARKSAIAPFNLDVNEEHLDEYPYLPIAEQKFIEGAKWQKEQDTRDMLMSDNRHFNKVYELGKKDMKEQMMKEAVKWLVDDDYYELTDKGRFILGSVGIGYNGYYIPYSDLLKLPKEDEK